MTARTRMLKQKRKEKKLKSLLTKRRIKISRKPRVKVHRITMAECQELITQAVREAKPKPATWRMGDGRVIEIALMDEGHLRNAISYCARRLSRQLSDAIWLSEVETYVRGLADFLAEARRRGIRV